MARQNFAQHIQAKFAYDVSALEPYVEAQSTEIMTDLVFGAGLVSRITVQENNKGSEYVKLLTSAPVLQSAASCGWTPSGGVVLTDKTLTTVRLKIQEEYCNEDLNGTWAQIYNAAGANVQDETEPDFADIMIAYYAKRARNMNQRLMFLGDTTSLDPNLAHYDGFLKLWENDPSVVTYYSSQTTITTANALSLALGLYATIDPLMHDNDVRMELMVGRETYRKIIENVYNDNNFHHTLSETSGSEPSFILPTTNLTVRAYPELTGTDEMIIAPLDYMIFGTDLENDMEGFRFVYDVHDEKLHFGVKWRSGIQYVFGQYFTRLRLTPTS